MQVGPDNERFGPMVILGGDGRIFFVCQKRGGLYGASEEYIFHWLLYSLIIDFESWDSIIADHV